MAGGSKARPQGVNRLNRHQCEGEFAESEVTIYRNAVNPMEMNKSLINQTGGKRISSSSEEEGMDTSDEVERLEVDNLTIQTKLNDKVMQFIADNRPNLGRRQMEDTGRLETIGNREQQMQQRDQNRDVDQQQQHMQPRRLSKSEIMIHDAEKSKARIYDVPGRQHEINLRNDISPQTPIVHSALLDEDYLLVVNYVDETTRNKIGNGEYVDFAKLMPCDWINAEEDNRMEIVNHGGMSYWVPIADKDSTSISSYLK